MKVHILILSSIGWLVKLTQSVEVPCSEDFCITYLEDNVCPTLGKNCDVQEPNFKGIELPFTGPCNCCPYCLEYLELGDDCPIGGANSIIPVNLCGPGLTCVEDPTTHLRKCDRMKSTKCTQEQYKYDKDVETGNVGNRQVRPICDERGEYEAYKCIPGEICYCVDEDGLRIFGEIPYTTMASHILDCGCSRHNAKAARFLNSFGNTWSQMRCNSDGSFDKIQCLSNGCLCVDKEDGKPTYPDADLVNATTLSNSTIKCFDNEAHTEEFFRVCEDIFRRNYEEDQKYITEGYDPYGSIYPKCQMDGYYAPVQHNDEYIYCSDINGKIIEDYKVPLADPLSIDMNCKCARANLIIVGLDKPKCCANGNYEKMQCRRGECRCVDSDGNQIEKEVDYDFRETLSCFESTEYIHRT